MKVTAGLVALLTCLTLPLRSEPPRKITIDGKFDDWKSIRAYTDAPNNEHVTSSNKADDKPEQVDHADVDLLEYKVAHDTENLFAYFKARGVIGRTQKATPPSPPSQGGAGGGGRPLLRYPDHRRR